MDRIRISQRKKCLYLIDHQGHGYPIDFWQLQTIADVREWLFQLEQKRWFTPKVRRQFIAAVKRINRWE